jgi:hypothetical protein
MAELVNKLPGQDPALLLKQEGVLMAGVDVRTRECDGRVVVALRGQLDVAEAAGAAAAFMAVAARGPECRARPGPVIGSVGGRGDLLRDPRVRSGAVGGRGMGWMRTWRRVWSFGSFATS